MDDDAQGTISFTELKGSKSRGHRYNPFVQRTPCVGRQAELEVLARLLDDARAGTTHFAVIEGESGIGKSRLLAEVVAHRSARGFAVYRGEARELHPRPFGLLADALSIDPQSSDPDRRAIATLLNTDADEQMMDRRYCVIDGIIDLIEHHAIREPVLLVLDDLHRSDPSSTQTLHVLCRRLAYLPVLILMTSRRRGLFGKINGGCDDL